IHFRYGTLQVILFGCAQCQSLNLLMIGNGAIMRDPHTIPSNGMIVVVLLRVAISDCTCVRSQDVPDRNSPLLEPFQNVKRRPWGLECFELVAFGVEPHVSCGMF